MRFEANELILIRHAPAAAGGRPGGPTVVRPADAGAADPARLAGASRAVPQVVASPALRCRQSATGQFPGCDPRLDPRPWEPGFGAGEGLPCADLPELGPIPAAALATRRPPGGESRAEMVARAIPAPEATAPQPGAPGPVAVAPHAGTVRAALARDMGAVLAASAFEVAPLAPARPRCHAGGRSVAAGNVTR